MDRIEASDDRSSMHDCPLHAHGDLLRLSDLTIGSMNQYRSGGSLSPSRTLRKTRMSLARWGRHAGSSRRTQAIRCHDPAARRRLIVVSTRRNQLDLVGRPEPGGRLEDVHPFPVAAGDLATAASRLDPAVLPVGQRVPEARPAHGEADEARHGRGGRQPLRGPSRRPRRGPGRCSRRGRDRRAARPRRPCSQSSRRSSPSIFQTSGSTPASCSSWIACTISPGRSSRS